MRQLLTHTSGFTSWLPLWSEWPDKASRIKAVMDQPLTDPAGADLPLQRPQPHHPRRPGREAARASRSTPSCARRITAPLGMEDTGYNPTDRSRTAATEYQTAPPRGMVRGEVHDENAWSLGGVAGHAGVFSTVDDLAILSQALLDGGTYRGHRILEPLERRAAHHRLQPGLPRRLARARLRARPALVHGRPLRPTHRGPHRLHRHVDRHRLRQPLLRDPADQPRAPFSRLGLGQHRSPRVGPRAGQRPADPSAGGAHVLVCRWFRRDDRHPDDAAPPGRRRRSPPRLRPLRRHRGDRSAAPRAVHRRRHDVDTGGLRRQGPGHDEADRRRPSPAPGRGAGSRRGPRSSRAPSCCAGASCPTRATPVGASPSTGSG